MAQQSKLKFPKPGIIVDVYPVGLIDRITGIILAAAAMVLLVALLLAAELRLTPEQRLDLLEVTYASP
jgi:hypothetical protein